MAKKSVYDDTYSLEQQCVQLLKSLKQTVEWLLSSCSSNVWNIYGNLSHLYAVVDKILSHGLRFETYWKFICGLHRLQPALAPPFFPSDIRVNTTTEQEYFRCHLWLNKSLQDHKLSVQLQSLILDYDHLQNYYYEGAFLRNKICTPALLICLKAVESNQPSLLASLDPVLTVDSVSQFQEPKSFLCYSNQSSSLKQCCDINTMQSLHSSCDSVNDNDYDSVCSCKTLVDSSKVTGHQGHQADISNNVNICVCTQNGTGGVHKHRWKPQHSKGKATPKLLRKKAPSEPGSVYHKQFLPNKSTNLSFSVVSHAVVQSPNTNEHIQSDDKALLPPSNNKKTNCQKVKLQRSRSYPDSSQKTSNVNRQKRSSSNSFCKSNFQSSSIQNHPTVNCANATEIDCRNYDLSSCNHIDNGLPDCENICVSADQALQNASPITPSEFSVTSPQAVPRKVHHSRSKSDISCSSISTTLDRNDDSESVLSLSLPSTILEEKSQERKSIFGGTQIVVPTECFFPIPQQGQSLTSFLTSNAFNICAELDKENAHFCIAEALISAIEHVKCTQALKAFEEENDSDEEIRSLKQRIRIRRRERQREKAIKNIVLLSDGRTDTTTSQSASSPLSSYSSGCDTGMSGTDDDVEDLELSDPSNSNLNSVKESGLSLSMASLYSDADIQRFQRCELVCATDGEGSRNLSYEANSSELSAETVALSLLKKYSEKQLPKASDLKWLVSEQDAPQRLLPLPDSWPISPDSVEEEYNLEKTRLRGNLEWAPPRAQIIFNIHPEPRRKEALEKQKYRCAGCGTRVEKSYISRFRYCNYLGKFFCQCCHSNHLAYIPARILRKWDFTKHYVSKFSYDLLDHMYGDPLFNVMDINNGLYKKARLLDQTRECRIKMYFLKDFIRTCRNAVNLREELEQYPSHVFSEPHLYSLSDLVEVRTGDVSKKLHQMMMKCITHVMQCVLCQAKGFICETCNNESDIIFPFQISKVSSCNACGACFHKKCFVSGECSKCARIEERKRRRDRLFLTSDEET